MLKIVIFWWDFGKIQIHPILICLTLEWKILDFTDQRLYLVGPSKYIMKLQFVSFKIQIKRFFFQVLLAVIILNRRISKCCLFLIYAFFFVFCFFLELWVNHLSCDFCYKYSFVKNVSKKFMLKNKNFSSSISIFLSC